MLALMALSLNLVSLAVEGATGLNLLTALFPLGDAKCLAALGAEQRDALVMFAIRAHANGFGVALIFFVCFCLFAGYLILLARITWRSDFVAGRHQTL